MSKIRMAYGVAGAIFALGLLITLRAAQSTPPMLARIDRKLADLQELRELADRHRTVSASLTTFDRLRVSTPRPLADIAASAGSERPVIRRRDAHPAAGGWNLVAATATFEDVPLSHLSAFIREATGAGERPPWRLVECSITALDQGRGRAVLVLESLEKPGP